MDVAKDKNGKKYYTKKCTIFKNKKLYYFRKIKHLYSLFCALAWQYAINFGKMTSHLTQYYHVLT